MKDQIVSKRAAEAGLVTKPKTNLASTSAPFDPRARRGYSDHSRIAGLRDATLNDPVSDLGAISTRRNYDYDALPHRDEPQRTFAMSRAAVAGVVDECMKAIANVMDKKMLVWNALGWLDVRKGMEKTIELVIANKTKAYPDGYKGDAVPVKVVEGEAVNPLLASTLELHDWMREHTGPSDGTLDMLKRSHDALVAAGHNPVTGITEADGIGDHGALPKRKTPLDLASLTKGSWFTAGKQFASLLCKVGSIVNERLLVTVVNGDWPLAFDRTTGACLFEGYMTPQDGNGVHINFIGPWKQGLQGYNEHLEYANEKIAERGE